MSHEFAELKRLIKQNGLLEKQPAYYTFKILLALSMLALGLTILVVVKPFWLQLLNAVYLAFVFTQISFIGHDCLHYQIFRSFRKTSMLGLLLGNLFVGMSYSWWADRHNRHHGHPNQLDLDPDIDTPFFSFSEEDARGKPKVLRFVVTYQAYLFFPLQVLAAVALRVWSIQFLLQKKARYPLTEAFAMALHFVLYFGLLLSRFSIWQVFLLVTIHQSFFGMYLGSVFAPNHKGMPTFDKNSPLDFLHQQVLTARNVKASPLTDFWYGGLNYQIEHHLFPTMPRNNLRKAQQLVKEFCKTRSIPYCETSMFQSYRAILHAMRGVSASLLVHEDKHEEGESDALPSSSG